MHHQRLLQQMIGVTLVILLLVGCTESGGGTQIAFMSDRDGNGEIYVMNADGSGQTNLTNNPAYDDEPAWSPR